MSPPLKDVSLNVMKPKKNASEQYQKLTQLEHILKRPDTYIGSTEPQEQKMWIYNAADESMEDKMVKIVPGLFKIFDEILVNAADNKIRDPNMKKLEKEKMWIPELIFGNLLTSSNYDDDEKKVTGGRNGYGAKLCNIFSTEFTVETADKNVSKTYSQTWKNNMSVAGKPKIKAVKKAVEYTKITFKPDLAKFHMEKLDDDILGVLRRRVYDLAGTVKDVGVYLNGTKLKIRNFKEYVEMYIKALDKKRLAEGQISEVEAQKKPTIIYKKIDDPKAKGRWEIAFGVADSSFNQISFVNSIATTSGGTHVNYIADQIIDKIQEILKKKHKKSSVKPFQIRNNMFLFINCLIENPAFTSQTKEQMSTRKPQFGSDCKIPDDFVNQIMKTEFIEKILDAAQANEDRALKRTDGARKSRLTNLPKLHDANMAGTKEGYKCTLILTEGDSALALAVAGLAVVGRDYYGCFPLRGKPLNVREATASQITNNAEINALKQIVGLQHKKRYEDTKSLRYGRVMLMTDQDTDGSHIKGLLINFIESQWPELLKIPGFLLEFITPIVKVNITKPRKDTMSFYSMIQYEDWVNKESHKYTWSHKYYKGLGTSTQEEGREYFSDLDRHLKTFEALQEEDKVSIDLAFSKSKADARKEWIGDFKEDEQVEDRYEQQTVGITQFINYDLRLHSIYDLKRSIPSVLDGLKPGQRKIMYGSLKRNLKNEIKVAQLAGYISEKTAYHHGEQSLVQTIIGLAQDFVGSNNINMLLPNGAFGTRLLGGKDASAPRYIFTALSPITSKILSKDDNALLKYNEDDGQTVEPEAYVPTVPMVLINGAEGIGTGYSTLVPQFNPQEIVANIRRLMEGLEMEEMEPWYKGWDGQVQKIGPGKYKMFGKIEKLNANTLAITELPPKMWISNMKEFLLQGLAGTEKVKPWIKDFEEKHGLNIRFVVTLSDEEMAKAEKVGLYEKFKLSSIINLSNMVLFDPEYRVKKYETVEEIMQDFYWVRLEYYQKRKDHLATVLQNELARLSSQARFLKLVIDGKLIVNNKKRAILVAELEKLNFPKFDKNGTPVYTKTDLDDITHDESMLEVDENDDSDEVDDEDANIHKQDNVISSFDYLLGMPIWSLTLERYQKILDQKATKEDELTELLKLTPKDIWNKDLDDFLSSWRQFLIVDEAKRTQLVTGKKKKNTRKRANDADDDWGSGPKKKTKKGKKDEDKFANIKGELIPIPDYVPPKVKKEPASRERSTGPKQSTLDSLKVKKEEVKQEVKVEEETKKEPEFKTFFGKGSTIFGTPKKESVFSLDSDHGEDQNTSVFNIDDDDVPVAEPVKPKTGKKIINKTVVKKPAKAKSAAPKKTTAGRSKKKTSVLSDEEDDSGILDDNDDDVEILDASPEDDIVPLASRSRASRGAQKKNYTFDISDDDDLDSFVVDDDDDDEDFSV
ncbi:K03164 DNA topoisomerase II [Cyberlindnera jadinii]|uniref:DNA topoisomerase 2 n=1 Tax=Cyberlindnera jadinii (strain ATCC 18201 / CBS 1600 / BCRC 20928 / JCM 3617 / NBRC 0987 / NRRL Y-1542) TaxID=983966 RepID=A0A0H5C6T3_CYBJN|nr:K03164 DNA topoisomerase II [Cyberlindnera jadinii]